VKLKLSEFFVSLILKKSFYGRLAAGLRRYARPGLGTMAVGVRDGCASFFYDPEFIEQVPFKTALFALEHEMLHLMLDHIPRFLELLAVCPTELDRTKAVAVYNIAMDAAVNNLLRNHEGIAEAQEFMLQRVRERHPDAPEDPRHGLVMPEKFDLPLDGHFELYQWLLMKNVKVIEISTQLLGPTTHELWADPDAKEKPQGQGGGDGNGNSEGSGDGKDLIFGGSTFSDMTPEELLSQASRARENAKQLLRKTIREMGGTGRGLFPEGVEEWLEAYLADPIVPWWEVFMTRARMSRNSKFHRSVALPNRALLALSEEDPRIIAMPGRMRDKAWRIFLYVDTSGSMSTDSLEIVKSELGYMLNADENMEIRYMQGDAATHMDVVLHTGDEIPGQMVGRGGTDFDSYFIHMGQYVNDDLTKPDLVVIYTDGYAPAVSLENRLPIDIPVLWLVTPQHSTYFHDNYGEVIVCDPEHNSRYKG
jgi:predicted metal-dependent peptidase